jgi:signal transduction histidine kinase
MLARLDHTRLLRYAGLFTWAVVALPLVSLWLRPIEPSLDLGEEAAATPVRIGVVAWSAYLGFGLIYAWLTRGLGSRRAGPVNSSLLLVLTGCAVAISYYSASGLGSILLMVVACVLPWLLPLPLGIAWLAVSQFLVVPVYVRGLGFTWTDALMQSVLYAGFCVFVFVTSLVARQQSQAREDQRRLNAELRATRALLAESARVNERTRISRELHDLLGHHLTALSLNLEVAGHLVEGAPREHINQAHTLARLLLSDVREAVSRLRDDDAIDMAATLLPLADNVPGLRIAMRMPEPFLLDDAERAHVLLRCTQEIITNAVRHAQADNLELEYRADDGAVRLRARDDGRGVQGAMASGNGLRGIRERLAGYGGSLEVDPAVERGFALDLVLPLGTDGAAALAPPAPAGPAVAVPG